MIKAALNEMGLDTYKLQADYIYGFVGMVHLIRSRAKNNHPYDHVKREVEDLVNGHRTHCDLVKQLILEKTVPFLEYHYDPTVNFNPENSELFKALRSAYFHLCVIQQRVDEDLGYDYVDVFYNSSYKVDEFIKDVSLDLYKKQNLLTK